MLAIGPKDFIVNKLARKDRGVQDEQDTDSVLSRQESEMDYIYLDRRAKDVEVKGILLTLMEMSDTMPTRVGCFFLTSETPQNELLDQSLRYSSHNSRRSLLVRTLSAFILFQLPREESEGGNGEGNHSHFIESPIERGESDVRERTGKPFWMRHLNKDNIDPDQQPKHKHRQSDCLLQDMFAKPRHFTTPNG